LGKALEGNTRELTCAKLSTHLAKALWSGLSDATGAPPVKETRPLLALLYGGPRTVMEAQPGLFSPPIHVVVRLTITKLNFQFGIFLKAGKKQQKKKEEDRDEPIYSARTFYTTSSV
jgi:hypothetical protein